jgi:hypothetical protein
MPFHPSPTSHESLNNEAADQSVNAARMGVIFEVDDGTRFAAKVAQSCIISTAEAQRATFVQEQFRSTNPGIVLHTTDVLFRD